MFEFNNGTEVLNNLTNKGAFLVSGIKPNVMVVSWALLGVLWGKRVMLVPVRESRYTKKFIDATGEFTVSIPFKGMTQELNFCGSKSGRDVDKFEQMHLDAKKADKVDTYYINGCEEHFECKVLTEMKLTKEMLPYDITKNMYKNGDFHTLYIAEIL